MIGFQARRLQPVARLAHRLVARAEADDAGLDAVLLLDDRLRHELARSLEFLSQPVERLLIVFFVFGILCVGVVARAAREIRSLAVRVARDRSVRNAVAVLVEVAAEFLALLLP